MPRIVPPEEIPPPAADPEDIEDLAALEHTQWQGWTEYMLDKQEEELELRGDRQGLETFRALPCVLRWRRQIVQHYSELPEKERESDRNEVRLKLPLYRKG